MTSPHPCHLELGARCEIGLHRRNNQDSAFAGDHAALVADGVGGGPGGDIASSTVIRSLVDNLPAPEQRTPTRLRELVRAANSELRTRANEDHELQGMATTLTGLVLGAGYGLLIHVGDSRCFRLRDGQFEQLTVDQSWVQLLVEQRLLSAADAGHHPMRNMLLHSLSGALVDPAAVQIRRLELRPGDRFVLGTDGLFDYLAPELLASMVASTAQPQDLADLLLGECHATSRDNITVVVADVVCGPAAGIGRQLGAAGTMPPTAAKAG